jgi:hypothetical protein
MFNEQKTWPIDEIFFQLLSKKYYIESISKNSILPQIRNCINLEKNQTLSFFCSPVFSNLHRLFSENSSDILNIFLLYKVKKKKKIIKKLLLFGIHIIKILYEFNFNGIYLSKTRLAVFSNIYNYKQQQYEKIQKNFKIFNSDVYFWEFITLSKAILIESSEIFYNLDQFSFSFMSQWLIIFKKICGFCNQKYKWGTYILNSILYQKNLSSCCNLIKNRNIAKVRISGFFIDLFDGCLLEKSFEFCSIAMICTFLNSETRTLIINQSIILVKYEICFSGTISKYKINQEFSTISDSFRIEIADDYQCVGDSLNDNLNLFSFRFSYFLFEKIDYFKNKTVDFFEKKKNYNQKKKKIILNYLNIKNFRLKIEKKKYENDYDLSIILKSNLLIFFYLKFSIAFCYRKKTNLSVWVNFIREITFCNYYLNENLMSNFIFLIFPKFYKNTKKSNIKEYLGIYLEFIFNHFNRILNYDTFNNFSSNQNFLILEISITKIKKLITNYYFLFGYYNETKLLKNSSKQKILYIEKYGLFFIKANSEILIRRLLDLTGYEYIQTLFNILGEMNQNGKYYELISEFNRNKISENKYLIGLLLLKKKKINNAKKQIFISVSFNPKHLNGWLYLGYIASILDDFLLCFRSYNKILTEEPSNNCAWVNLSLLLFRKFKNKTGVCNSIKQAIKNKNNSLIVIKIYIYCSLDRNTYSWINLLEGLLLLTNSSIIEQFLKYKILYQSFLIFADFITKKENFFELSKKKIQNLTEFIYILSKIEKKFLKFFFNFVNYLEIFI